MYLSINDVPEKIRPFYTTKDDGIVVELPRGETKTWSDVKRVIVKHRGQRDDLVESFVSMVNEGERWAYHDNYLSWLSSEPSPLELPSDIDSDEAAILTESYDMMAHQWEQSEPTYPTLVTWGQYKKLNCNELRQAAYAPDDKQLEMMNDDHRNGTRNWIGHQDAVKAQYPKP